GQDHMLARALDLLRRQVRRAHAFAALAALGAHGLERAYTALIALAPGLDTLANPGLLLRQALVEGGIGAGLVFQCLFLGAQIALVIAGIRQQPATIQINDARRQRAQESAVVGHEQQ